MPHLTRLDTAAKLPPRWDELAKSEFQRRGFLSRAERTNPCRQRYYCLYEGKTLRAGAIVYTLGLDLFTYLGIPSPVTMQIVGVPASASPSGLIGAPRHGERLLEELSRIETGLLLALNLDAPFAHPRWSSGPTLPSMVLQTGAGSFSTYLDSLRAPYRRRIRKSQARFERVTEQHLPMGAFTPAMHDLYLDVFGRSDAKLERLTLPFFQALGDNFRLTTFTAEGHLIGWHVTLREPHQLVFFMGGIDYRYATQYDTYFNSTISITRQALESGYKQVDFGQTAEIPKARLGARPVHKHMAATHSNPLLSAALVRFGHHLAYHREIPAHTVFKERTTP